MRRARRVVLLGSVLLFLGCSPSFKPAPLILKTSPFTKSKLEVSSQSTNSHFSSEPSFITGESEYADVILPKGTALQVTFMTECLASNPDSKIHREVLEFDPSLSSSMSIRSFDWNLSENISARDLKRRLDQEQCLVGVSELGEVSSASQQSLNEPRRRFQKHMDHIHGEEALRFFYDEAEIPLAPIIVAVVDTGVDYTHEDLRGQMWTNSNGEVGYDFYDRKPDHMDVHGHGTHVAGLIAAENGNRIGVSSPAGGHTKIMALRALGGDISFPMGSSTSVTNSIYFAADNGASVINLSLGGKGINRSQQHALEYAVRKGVVVVAASGNSNIEISNSNPYSPAIFGRDLEGLLTVGALDLRNSQRARFSNYSTSFVEFVAPGAGGLHSTILANKYKSQEGTSMAAPLVASGAALVMGFLKARNEVVTPQKVEEILRFGSPSNPNLVPFFREGASLDFLSLIEHLNKEYGGSDEKWEAEPQPYFVDGELAEMRAGLDKVEVAGTICNRDTYPPGTLWVGAENGPLEPLETQWHYSFAWKDECVPGNIVQHQFWGHAKLPGLSAKDIKTFIKLESGELLQLVVHQKR